MMSGWLLIVILIGVGIFVLLLNREKARAAKGESRLATWRLILAALFGLVALFSGGCSLLFIPDLSSSNMYVDGTTVAVIGGIPFAIACLVVWLSLRRGNG